MDYTVVLSFQSFFQCFTQIAHNNNTYTFKKLTYKKDIAQTQKSHNFLETSFIRTFQYGQIFIRLRTLNETCLETNQTQIKFLFRQTIFLSVKKNYQLQQQLSNDTDFRKNNSQFFILIFNHPQAPPQQKFWFLESSLKTSKEFLYFSERVLFGVAKKFKGLIEDIKKKPKRILTQISFRYLKMQKELFNKFFQILQGYVILRSS
eukprot:TRINITY_DN7683_c0_g2_i1.p1 TRINITY_DN7683_c0_g2~~TRINITY_DN7683_c0_g2_i1.p1  ORF type:complete len:205 (-),score=-4.04 TRINITY_DN7683_c0_g2_i1:139-753(-)